MKKVTLRKCFICWSGYGCGGKGKLPRKKKKALKTLHIVFGKLIYLHYMDFLSSCDADLYYKRWKTLLQKLPFLLKYKREIFFIQQYYGDEEVYFDENGRLCWFWGSDDDYTGGSSGVMPFCYSEAEAGNTWAYDEVWGLVSFVWRRSNPGVKGKDFVFPSEINSDAALLRYISKSLNTVSTFYGFL